MATTQGTSHFVSVPDAVRYYRDHEGDDAENAVARKITDGEIHIGPPTLKPGETLSTIDNGTRYAITATEQPASVLTKKQTKTYGPRPITGYGKGATLTAEVRYDDQCGNGHNTFSITGEVRIPGRRDIEAGGCLHDDIARKFPELAPLIKWHLVSSDGPLHYLANTLYHADDRDHWGLRKGEFRQHTSRGPCQAGGVAGVPCWELRLPQGQAKEVYAHDKPAPLVLEWQPNGITGEGKARELDHARSSAVWPDATDEDLTAPGLQQRLEARLPALMAEFRAAVESLGFTY
jgi:hypothetical protein